MTRTAPACLVLAATFVAVSMGVLSRNRATDNASHAYQFIIRPGEDPAVLRLDFHDARMVEVDRTGNLIVTVGDKATRASRPQAYQQIGGHRRDVDVRFMLDVSGDVRFAVGSYNRTQPLIIDSRH
jgi:hypothetical protein